MGVTPLKEEREFHVLVVDDDPGVRESLRMIVKEHYRYLEATSVPEALGQLASRAVDIVALDIHLPELNGLALLKYLQKGQEDVQVFLITGYPSLDTATEALRWGAYDYLAKPFDRRLVLEVLRRGVIRRRRRLVERTLVADLLGETGEAVA